MCGLLSRPDRIGRVGGGGRGEVVVRPEAAVRGSNGSACADLGRRGWGLRPRVAAAVTGYEFLDGRLGIQGESRTRSTCRCDVCLDNGFIANDILANAIAGKREWH